ncbi:MAG: hypothetical protein QOD75_3151 [Blastocatellia bacterium]|jgi:hypothetical protein|nr:hypothetical protein [Blastocatellia bacterium]
MVNILFTVSPYPSLICKSMKLVFLNSSGVKADRRKSLSCDYPRLRFKFPTIKNPGMLNLVFRL